MGALLDKIPQNVRLITLGNISSHKSLKLSDLHEYSQSLDETEQHISNEEERQKHNQHNISRLRKLKVKKYSHQIIFMQELYDNDGYYITNMF